MLEIQKDAHVVVRAHGAILGFQPDDTGGSSQFGVVGCKSCSTQQSRREK
jgi:hypothetical protein